MSSLGSPAPGGEGPGWEPDQKIYDHEHSYRDGICRQCYMVVRSVKCGRCGWEILEKDFAEHRRIEDAIRNFTEVGHE